MPSLPLKVGMAMLAIGVGSLLVLMVLTVENTITETVYVPLPTPHVVFVDRVVERVVEVPVERERQVVEVVATPPNVVPPQGPPVAPLPPEPPPAPSPPVVVTPPPIIPATPVPTCVRQGQGMGHQRGVCRRQGFR